MLQVWVDRIVCEYGDNKYIIQINIWCFQVALSQPSLWKAVSVCMCDSVKRLPFHLCLHFIICLSDLMCPPVKGTWLCDSLIITCAHAARHRKSADTSNHILKGTFCQITLSLSIILWKYSLCTINANYTCTHKQRVFIFTVCVTDSALNL